jgi:ribosomal protein S18 acetylase RimI-like enzyme
VSYPKDVVLKNKKRVVLRPFQAGDEDLLKQFYGSFPDRERWFIPYDMMKPELQCRWSEEPGVECLYSIVAFCEDRLVAHANLHVGGKGHYTSHVGRVLIKVQPSFRQQRLGTWMILDLIKLAMEKELGVLRVDLVVGIDDATIDGLLKFDFKKEATLPAYALDPEGRCYDLLIMIKHLHKDFGDF